MLTPERHELILTLIKAKGTVKLQELVDATKSSESTIRRDLVFLETERKLKRIHGGASLLQGKQIELSNTEKAAKNLHEKRMIAKEAVALISEGDSIYIDAGTTTAQMVQFLDQSDLTVVTNGVTLIEPLLDKGIRTFLLGGAVKSTTRALVGRTALSNLRTFRFDKCFIGVNGVHTEFGYTTPDPEEAAIKFEALELSQEKYVLADQSKLGEISFSKIADIKQASLILNDTEDDRMEKYKKITSLKVVTT